MQKERLIILSDMWGLDNTPWLYPYIDKLSGHFEIEVLDSCEIGQIEKGTLQEKKLHSQFLQFGITIAINHLCTMKPNIDHLLGFSIGGTIAWQYALRDNSIKSLTCVSSTRLRYESTKPDTQITLIYGADDPYRPSELWSQNMEVDNLYIKEDQGHEMYKYPENVAYISSQIIAKLIG